MCGISAEERAVEGEMSPYLHMCTGKDDHNLGISEKQVSYRIGKKGGFNTARGRLACSTLNL